VTRKTWDGYLEWFPAKATETSSPIIETPPTVPSSLPRRGERLSQARRRAASRAHTVSDARAIDTRMTPSRNHLQPELSRAPVNEPGQYSGDEDE